MPGIVGLITKLPREAAKRQLQEMTAALCHERFYTSGMWIDENQGVYVGWVARRGSFAENMPICNERGEVTMVFSGEEFPEPNTIANLGERGHEIEPNLSAYLVHRYEDEPDFPRQLNGRFHGLVTDSRHGLAMLFNDRFGLQRLYYHEAKDSFYFAAEAKAILRVRPELRSLDGRGLGEFIACGCVLENRTLFSGIRVLPPGSSWVFQHGSVKSKAVYFEPTEWEEVEPLESEQYYSGLQNVIERKFPRYFNGRERVGVSLTGGLDTRIIMAWGKARSNSLPCYTFGSVYRDNQDVKLARRVAKICGQQHQVIVTGEEFLKRFAYYAERSINLSDACVDLTRSPDLYVNEKVREIAPVRIVGTYGSEILLHAVMFKADEPAAGLYHEEVLNQVRTAQETYAASRDVNPVTFAAFRQSPWHHYGILGLEQTQVSIRSPFLDNDLVRAVYKAPAGNGVNDVRLRLIRDGDARLARVRTDRGIRGLNSVVTRAFLEFLFKAEYAYDYGMPQWIAKVDHQLRAFHLERLWLGRHKVFHFRVWYRDQLADYVREMLLDSRSLSRPYVVPNSVRNIVYGHLKGNRNYTTEISRLITLELTHRLFLDGR